MQTNTMPPKPDTIKDRTAQAVDPATPLFGFRADDGETVIWAWQPDPADFVKFDDVASAYVITACERASSGKVILYAKYGSEWTCNPWTPRPVLARMLGKVGGVVHEPNIQDQPTNPAE